MSRVTHVFYAISKPFRLFLAPFVLLSTNFATARKTFFFSIHNNHISHTTTKQ
jgi:hypothetical protein